MSKKLSTAALISLSLVASPLMAQQKVARDERVHWRQVRMLMSDYPEASEIRETCAFVTNVENRFAGGNQNVAKKRILRQAGNRGANVVIVHRDSTEGREWVKALFTGYSATGEAYRCS